LFFQALYVFPGPVFPGPIFQAILDAQAVHTACERVGGTSSYSHPPDLSKNLLSGAFGPYKLLGTLHRVQN